MATKVLARVPGRVMQDVCVKEFCKIGELQPEQVVVCQQG